jgi:hypothetical protein
MTTTTTTPAAAPAPAPEPASASAPSAKGRRSTVSTAARRHSYGVTGTLEHCLLALIAFVPLLAVDPGIVTSDTKTYLYLDPGRFLSQVANMWNPTVGLGTVTHEYIGYLLPMGPFYWFFSEVHVPVWVAQRLWLGGILFAAGSGILFLAKVLSLRGPGRLVAALAFTLSPYFLQYSGRISVILLPWAGLPWMVALIALALRRGGWRYPALFALVVALVSSINASSIIYVGVAPILWLIYAVVIEREATWRQAGLTACKIALLTLLCCLWWIIGLEVEAAYGVDVLKYTETVPSTSETSSAAEVIRGLGYWYFYGGDRLGPWTNAAVIYTQQVWLIALSYVIPVLAFLAAVFVRWRHRAYFVALVVVGMVLSVGAHPIDNPTPVGGVLKAFMTDTTAGLAMRSTDRATPLVLLGLALLLGTGVTALWRRVPWIGLITAIVVAGLVIANNPAMFDGDAEISSFFTQPATLPNYQMQAINHLNGTHPNTRVLAIPGNDFASFSWGDTVDTPQPAFLNRPFVTREQQIMGSMATADTLYAMDQPVQEGTENWSSLAPMARLLSAGDVLVEYDQNYGHYGVPQPQLLAPQLAQTPAGLSDPVSYGSPVPNISSTSTLDEQDLASPANPAWPEPLTSYTVDNPRPLVRGESNTGALVVAGDAEGLENLAGAGLLDTNSAIYFSGTLAKHPAQLHQLLGAGAGLVLTDTNRKQAFRWDTLTANYGETETPAQNPAKTDLSDSAIDLFPGTPLSAHSLATYVGAVNVTASSYGQTISYTPEDRAYNAIDGNLDTNWETGTFVANPSGQWWQVHFTSPATTDHITLVQPITGDVSRWITRATLSFNGGAPVTENLGPSSRVAAGQVLSFPQRSFSTLRVTIDATSNDHAPPALAAGVGLSEVQVPGQHVVEVIAMPEDLLKSAGTASLANRLSIVMNRQRVSPYPPRSDPETTISREFTLPTSRTFTVSGAASISPLIPDDQIDRLVGRPGTAGTGIVAYSKGRMPGSLTSGAAAALDGNPATAWQPGWGAVHQKGQWLEYALPRPVTFNHLNLQIVADGRHSVPTSLTVSTEHGSRQILLPPVADSATAGAVATVPVSFLALSGHNVKITVTGVRLEYTTNFYNEAKIALPLGVAEVGIPGLVMPPVPPAVPVACRTNLISIDGHPVGVRIVGSSASALANGDLPVEPCGPSAGGITLGPGPHIVETALGHSPLTGWNVDQLVLDSAPGGGPAPLGADNQRGATQPGPAPSVTVDSAGTSSESVQVRGATAPFELVLGQSVNAGWQAVARPGPGASAGARSVNLGPSQLVDSFANGWPVSAAQLRALGGNGTFTVSMSWAPQSTVWLGLLISASTLGLCVLLAVVPRRWLRSRRRGGRPTRRTRRRTPQGPAASVNGIPAAVRGVDAGTTAPVPDALVAPGAPSPRPTPDRAEATSPVTLVLGAGDRPGAEVPAERPPLPALSPEPALTAPFARRGQRPPLWAIVLIAAATGAIGAAAAGPLVGLAAGVATAGALLVPQARVVTATLAVGLLIAAAVSVVHGQAQHPIPESSDWPSAYENAGLLVWMAVVFLGADAVADAARSLAKRRPKRPKT